MRKRITMLTLVISVIATMLFTTVIVSAVVTRQKVTALLASDMTIVYNDVKQIMRDGKGNVVYPIIYNNSTYVPLRAVGSIFGQSTYLDPSTETIYLGSNNTIPTPKPVQPSGHVVIWSYTDQVKKQLDDYYKSNSTITYEVVMNPIETYQTKLATSLKAGTCNADIIFMESAFFKNYAETSYLMDLSSLEEKAKISAVYPYTMTFGKNSAGQLKAYATSASPGAMFYRKSFAKKYLGSDDPAQIQAMFADHATLLTSAKKLYATSSGKCKLTASPFDLYLPYLGARQNPWVKNGSLVIDNSMLQFLDLGKEMITKGYTPNCYMWDPSWFAGMNDTLKSGNTSIEIFSYFMPKWGMDYVLRTNANNPITGLSTHGDWAVVKGPASFFWGGDWAGVNAASKNPDAAKSMVEFLAFDETYHKNYAIDAGTVMPSANAMNSLTNTTRYGDVFLGGQNPYTVLCESASLINGSLFTNYDADIDNIWKDAASLYFLGKQTREQAITNFKRDVKMQFPALKIQ